MIFSTIIKSCSKADVGPVYHKPKCTPAEGQEYPEGGTNEEGKCFPLNEDGEWECPDGYHNIEDDETCQCYPDDAGYPRGTIMSDSSGNGINENR